MEFAQPSGTHLQSILSAHRHRTPDEASWALFNSCQVVVAPKATRDTALLSNRTPTLLRKAAPAYTDIWGYPASVVGHFGQTARMLLNSSPVLQPTNLVSYREGSASLYHLSRHFKR